MLNQPEPSIGTLQSESNPAFEQTAEHALELVKAGAPQSAILTCLARGAENAAGPDAVCSILLLDEDGCLRNGASPSLPDDYLSAIDGIKPDRDVGTCAAAAATGSMVITPDFYADDKWAELRHLPLELGFVGAWSMPIISPEGLVVGTFGTYFRERRSPSPAEIAGVRRLAEIAAKTFTPLAS